MDSNPTSKVSEENEAKDQQSSRKLSISSQVREYYSYSDSRVPAKPQSKSLPAAPTESFKEDDWAKAITFQSLTDVGRPVDYLPRRERRDCVSIHENEWASLYNDGRLQDRSNVEGNARADYSDGPKSLNQLVTESRDINAAVKAALQASLDTSGPRVPSPASSIASNKRGLEWDSGADVGYQYEQRDSSHLSIIERLALARGSAAFQLGSSGTGTLCTSGDMSISLKQKADVKSLSKSLASLEIAKTSNPSQSRAVGSLNTEPLAQSTPQEVGRRSLILAAAAENEISPVQSSGENSAATKFPTMKSLSATDLCPQKQVETIVNIPRRKSDTNIFHADVPHSSSTPLVSSRPVSSKKTEKHSTHKTRDQIVQTSNTVPLLMQSSIGIQAVAGERSDYENKSRKESSSSSDKSMNKVSVADAARFIAQIQRNASEHQKVIDKIKQQNLCDALCTGAIKKGDYSPALASGGPNQERSSSSSDFNEAPFSVNVTNEHGTIGSANSFEYLPGDVYENANARKLQSPDEPKSNDAVAWGVISNSLARDLEEGLQNFKTLLANKKDLDPQTKDQLIKRLVRKLIETDYQEDEESSTTGASVVYVPNQTADEDVGSSRSSARQQHRKNVLPCRARSPVSDPGMHGDWSSPAQLFRPPRSSEHSSLPYSTSTSTSTTLETKDWRLALTQSEKRRQPEKRKPHSPGKRNNELAQITRKIHQLNKLKQLLEQQDDQRCGDRALKISPNIYTVMTMLGVSGNETEESLPVAESSVELTASEENWSSHHRLGTTRTVQTQFPSRVQLPECQCKLPAACASSSSTSESWDTSLDHRARLGRINVFVQTSNREADSRRSAEKQADVDPLCCCQCARKLAKLRELSAILSTPKTTPPESCCCLCHARSPRSPGRRLPVADCASTGSNRSVKGSTCECESTPTPQASCCDASRLKNAATSTTSIDAKIVQTTDSVAALPIIQPRWFPSSSNQELKREKEVCKCCGNENEKQSSKILSDSINLDNIPKSNEYDPCKCTVCFKDRRLCQCRCPVCFKETQLCQCRCAVCFKETRICQCMGRDKLWDVSAISNRNVSERRRQNVSTRSLATETDPPKALGYLLTFETPSGSDASLEPPRRPPLKEVRVKAPRRGRPSTPPEPAAKRSSVELPMQTSTPSSESLAGLRRRDSSNRSTNIQPAGRKPSTSDSRTLQDYLRSNRPDYIETAEHRRQCLVELAHLRELRLQSRRKLLALASAPAAEVLSSLPPPPLATKRVFSQRTMLRQTRRLTQRTEEVGKKRVELKRKEDYRTNRLMAEMFARKLQKNALKGSVNLSNSKSVI